MDADKTVNRHLDDALQEKLYAAEEHISWVRFVIILFNSFVYIFLFEGDNHIPWLAWSIIVLANIYSVFVVAFKPYKKYPLLLSSYFSTTSDTLLITFWVMATGFAGSPFYVIMYISIIAIAMRFSIKETVVATLAYISGYIVVMLFEEGDVIPFYDIAARLGYIPIAALLGIYFSRELVDQIDDKAKTKEAQAELKIVNDNLELRVKERTAELEEKNADITSSIKYAHHIQNAILPSLKEIKDNFSDAYILYLPKDIISGDFYWFHHDHNKNTCFVAAVDCTGHGVPGALMSIMGADMLNQYVREGRMTEPSGILYQLDQSVSRTLKQKSLSTLVNDGMEMALCKFSCEGGEMKLIFSGAGRPLYIIRDGKVNTYKGSKKAIGGNRYDEEKLFQQTEIPIRKGDLIYLFSDGYLDQFGGPENKKYLKKRFQELLLTNAHLPLEEQKKELHLELIKWQGTNKQVDDILVMGLKV